MKRWYCIMILLLIIGTVFGDDTSPFNDLKKNYVKIKVKVNDKVLSQGTGFICYKNNTPILITAYHVFFTPEFSRVNLLKDMSAVEKLKNATIDLIFSEDIKLTNIKIYENNKSIIKAINADKDFIIFDLFEITPDLPSIEILQLDDILYYNRERLLSYKTLEQLVSHPVSFFHYPVSLLFDIKRFYSGYITSLVWPLSRYNSSNLYVLEINPGIISPGTSGSNCFINDSKLLGIVNWEYRLKQDAISPIGYVSVISIDDIEKSFDDLKDTSSDTLLTMITSKRPGEEFLNKANEYASKIKKAFYNKNKYLTLTGRVKKSFMISLFPTSIVSIPFTAAAVACGSIYYTLDTSAPSESFQLYRMFFQTFLWLGAGHLILSLGELIGFIISTAIEHKINNPDKRYYKKPEEKIKKNTSMSINFDISNQTFILGMKILL